MGKFWQGNFRQSIYIGKGNNFVNDLVTAYANYFLVNTGMENFSK